MNVKHLETEFPKHADYRFIKGILKCHTEVFCMVNPLLLSLTFLFW